MWERERKKREMKKREQKDLSQLPQLPELPCEAILPELSCREGQIMRRVRAELE